MIISTKQAGDILTFLSNPTVLILVMLTGLAVLTFSFYVLKQYAAIMTAVTAAIEKMTLTLTQHKERQDTEKSNFQDKLIAAFEKQTEQVIKIVELNERILLIYEQERARGYQVEKRPLAGD